MEIKDFIKKYWHDAVNAERELKVPAVYLLAHAIIATDASKKKATELVHGFEVIIPVKVNKFKQFWVDLWDKVKSWFKKEEKIVTTKIERTDEHIEDYIIHFFDNVSYHAKFEYLQSIDRFAIYVWIGKKYEYLYTKEFKDTVNKIQEALKTI